MKLKGFARHCHRRIFTCVLNEIWFVYAENANGSGNVCACHLSYLQQ